MLLHFIFIFFIYIKPTLKNSINPLCNTKTLMDPHDSIAPFVLKTYHMVNDPSLDTFIRWGISNNTFIILKPQHFSQHLLPANFKHNNFSSFVRQLNTYGFKKVDPDRWEFANQWFLRGQTHLLKNIGRKKQQINNRICVNRCDEDDDDDDGDEMVVEIEKLKREQKVLEQEMVEMNKRLETTERRPEQMMALLHKVADDPQIFPRMMLQVDQRSKRLLDQKRQRIFIAPTSPSPSPSSLPSPSLRLKMKEEEDCQIVNEWTAASPEDCYGDEVLWPSSSPATLDAPSMSRQPTAAARGGGSGSVMDESGGGFSPVAEVKLPPDYPFSLFYGGL